MYKITYKGKSDAGRIRTNNEDAYIVQTLWDDKHVLGVAIDGVGGYDGGERAAEIAKESIVSYLKKYPNGERLDLLKQAVVDANNKILKERNTKRQFPKMSCVLTACLVEIEKKQINMAHVGDTRLYQYCHGKLKKLSHDHSLVGYREEIGNLTEKEAMNHPQRNIINRLIGDEMHQVDDQDFLEASTFPLLSNTTLLLCSDGLCDMLTSAEMVLVLQQDIPLEEKVDQLILCANNKGGKDNITVVLIEYSSNEEGQKNPNVEQEFVSNLVDTEAKGKTDVKELESGKKNRNVFKFLLFILLTLMIGLAAGWLLHERYSELSGKISLNSVLQSKDTAVMELNDSSSIRVTGIDLARDTILKENQPDSQ